MLLDIAVYIDVVEQGMTTRSQAYQQDDQTNKASVHDYSPLRSRSGLLDSPVSSVDTHHRKRMEACSFLYNSNMPSAFDGI